MIVEWIQDSGEAIYLGAMSSPHIVNCIKYIQSGKMRRPSCSGFSNAEWIQIFKVELNRRYRRMK